MRYSRKDSARFEPTRAPTLEDMAKYKEEYHAKQTKLPFVKKLKILNAMVEERSNLKVEKIKK